MGYAEWIDEMKREGRPVYFDADGRSLPHCLRCRINFVSIRDFRAHVPADGSACQQLYHRVKYDGWTVEYFGQHGFGVAAFRRTEKGVSNVQDVLPGQAP